MESYEYKALSELMSWKDEMRKKPQLFENTAKDIQNSINRLLPQKYHEIVTSAIKNLTRTVLFGSKYLTKPPLERLSLMERERLVREKIGIYKTAAAAEGAATGAGGFLWGLADFPLLLGIKIKYLYDAASIYGFDVSNYKERLYILNIFQLAFSSKDHANKVFEKMDKWDEYSRFLPADINQFDWESFQREYRDYIDLAKLLQLVPGIGAFVGLYANNKLMHKLGETSIQAYRMRLLTPSGKGASGR